MSSTGLLTCVMLTVFAWIKVGVRAARVHRKLGGSAIGIIRSRIAPSKHWSGAGGVSFGVVALRSVVVAHRGSWGGRLVDVGISRELVAVRVLRSLVGAELGGWRPSE